MANTSKGPWTAVAHGTFRDPLPAGQNGVPAEKQVKRLIEPVYGQFVQYQCLSWYGSGCALHYIEVTQG